MCPTPDFDRGSQFRDGFVVAVQNDPLGREVGVQRDGQFPAGGHVQRKAFFVDPARDLAAQEGLGRVVHVGAPTERRRHLPAAAAEVFLVDDEQRGSVLVGEVDVSSTPGNAGNSVVVASRVAGPHVRRQPEQLVGRLRRAAGLSGVTGVFGVPGAGGLDVHMRSGALTPSIRRPFAITWRVA